MTPLRSVAPLLAAALLAFVTPAQAKAPEPWTSDDTLDAIAHASPLAACIVTGEVGGVGFDPYAVGAAGEIGPAQLHPRGLLPDFRYGRWTDLEPAFRDPNSPYMAVAYIDWAISQGMGPNWSTWWGCV